MIKFWEMFKLIVMNQVGSAGDVDVSGDVSDSGDVDSSSDDDSSDSTIGDSDSSNAVGGVAVQAETEEELQEEIEQAVEEGASKEEIKNMLRSYELKVNGKKFVKNIDLNDEEGLKKELQLAAAGRMAMQESAELKKLYTQEIDRLRKQPVSVLRDLGMSEDELIEMFANEINSYVERKQRPKEEVEQEERVKEFEKLKKEKEELENRLKDRERQEAMAKVEQELEFSIMDALDNDPDLPNDPETIAMIADTMLWAIDQGFNDITPKDVIPTVKAELEQKFRKVAKSLKSPAALKALLGDDVLNQLRDERIQQAKKITSVKDLKKPTNAPKLDVKTQGEKKKLSDIFR